MSFFLKRISEFVIGSIFCHSYENNNSSKTPTFFWNHKDCYICLVYLFKGAHNNICRFKMIHSKLLECSYTCGKV